MGDSPTPAVVGNNRSLKQQIDRRTGVSKGLSFGFVQGQHHAQLLLVAHLKLEGHRMILGQFGFEAPRTRYAVLS